MLEIVKNLQIYAEEQPNVIALQFDDEQLTYAEFYEAIKEALSDYQGLLSATRVGLLSESPMTNMIHYFAVLMQDAVPCFLDASWPMSTIDKLINTYNIQYIAKNDAQLIPTQSLNLKDSFFEEQAQIHNLLHIGFTSGTTGLPKAYYRNEPSWLASYIENEKLLHHDEAIFIAPGPLAHSLSLYTCIYALWSGRTFIGQRHFEASQLMQCIQRQSKSIALFLVPTMLSQLIHMPNKTKTLTSILSSGAKLSSQLFQDVTTTFSQANIIEFFGTSEASFISYNFNQTAPTDSVGQLFPNVTYQLEEQDKDQIGLLHVKSNMTFSGYVNRKVIQPESWIETGDYAYIKDQYLYLVSRKSERLIIGGKNIYPTAVEQRVKQLDGIDEAVMIGEPHTRFGEIAVLVYMGHRELDYLSLRRYLLQTLSRYEVPSKLVKVSALPFTNSGKVARGTLRELYLKGELEV
ncbi:long-chain fatty acid--CoA ligase [Staphylococcus pragensis]|uniref:Putative long chain fatty acid-CoA ligase VraA n=1 Tax=Staphylococcus pragensis TaxID=1611836 RepID=A0A4Z1BVJ8_9STAP|nr:AMP-binding protein [Staphylococcus pragensis]RTX91266.1 long-chain fatty acid--CoA ligase [Staphylococcus carnosus]TGN24461.1 long-chain fatty acid--CoA ligase [Staphylococcus pragensis]GGG98762.1 putative long chain fatty acid-CoA ligase VraA [Staphylococcus pragensis]